MFLKNYNFKKGITYIDTLGNHPSRAHFIGNHDLNIPEWKPYIEYITSLGINVSNLESIWEYFLILNNDGFNKNLFSFKNLA